MKQLEVQIMGQSYLLAAPEGGEQSLLDAVEKVDHAMCKIRDAGKVKARDRIAVLAALNLAFDTVADRSAPVSTVSTSVLANKNTTLHAHPQIEALIQKLDHALLTSDSRLL